MISNIKICVCTCGKNENIYIREFVEHYKKYNVDKIFIYDNNEENGEKFESVISDYINKGFVSIINYRGKLKIQMEVFNHCYKENKEKYNWFIYYDMDEFIHLKSFSNIKEYISKKIFNKCNIIYLNHVIHTDNNELHYFNKSLFERFPEIESFKKINMTYKPRTILLDLTKVIIRGNLTNITFENPHFINNITSCDGFGNILTNKYNNIKIFLSKSNFNKCNIIYLNHIIHTDNNNIYYQNKSLVKRFPTIENFKNINMSYQPRTILLDLTKIIIKGNLTNFKF